LLELRSNIEVVGEAADGHALLNKVRETNPDIAVVDITMPSLNGIEATARMSREHPDTKVVIVSAHKEVAMAVRALKAGASAYIIKDASGGELSIAIDAVLNNETYLSPAISSGIVDLALLGQDAMGQMDDPLTARQREVLQLVAEGLTSKKIGDLLSLSIRTVDAHRRRIMDVLEIHEVAGLVRYAIREGIIDP
jgi:DNA-binding NarL/FixJ family response regulator